MTTSAWPTMSRKSARPSAFFRSSTTLRLLLLNSRKYIASSPGTSGRLRRACSPPGGSILRMSAPSHPRNWVQDVPASNWVRSRTRIPLSARSAMATLPLGGEGNRSAAKVGGRRGAARDEGGRDVLPEGDGGGRVVDTLRERLDDLDGVAAGALGVAKLVANDDGGHRAQIFRERGDQDVADHGSLGPGLVGLGGVRERGPHRRRGQAGIGGVGKVPREGEAHRTRLAQVVRRIHPGLAAEANGDDEAVTQPDLPALVVAGGEEQDPGATVSVEPLELADQLVVTNEPLRAHEWPWSPARPACRRQASSRSEEHTSELQSPYDLVCRLLLEKKKSTCQPAYCQ